MRTKLQKILFLFYFVLIKAKKELPLCPSNMQFFPQNLPMHCRMPAAIAKTSGEAIPLPAPALAGSIPGVIQGPMPMPMPMAMPMPAIPPSPAHKLPVIVMPLYSPDKPTDQMRSRRKKHRFGLKRRPRHYYTSDEDSTDTDTSLYDSSDSDKSSQHGWWKRSREGRRSNRHTVKRRRNQKKNLLTPVLQYVTKDGYVIFEKQISKGEAKDWLVDKNNNKPISSKIRDNSNSKEFKDEEDTNFLMKNDENIEVKTEVNSHHRKKNVKRKLSGKHMPD